MKYPSVTHRSSDWMPIPIVLRTRLVAPSAPIRKSDCKVASPAVIRHPRLFRSIPLTRVFRIETFDFLASSIKYLDNSRRETTAIGSCGVTVTDKASPKETLICSMLFRGRLDSKMPKLDRVFAVIPPPQGFSHGA